jgi:excisionase family DNA binding protein
LDTNRITAPVEDFSRLTGLGVSTVWRMLNEGMLESIRIGRRRLIVLSSYYRLIEAQRAAPVPPVPMPKGRPRAARRSQAG